DGWKLIVSRVKASSIDGKTLPLDVSVLPQLVEHRSPSGFRQRNEHRDPTRRLALLCVRGNWPSRSTTNEPDDFPSSHPLRSSGQPILHVPFRVCNPSTSYNGNLSCSSRSATRSATERPMVLVLLEFSTSWKRRLDHLD